MEKTPDWKVILAFFIDLLIFIVLFFAISYLTGGVVKTTTLEGDAVYNAQLSWTAVALFIGLIVAYYKLLKKYLGGTVGKKILGISPKI